MKRIDKEVAKRLREFRKLKGLSQKELARLIGFSQRAVSHWENAESDIPTVALKRLKALGLNINWLLTGEGSPVETKGTLDEELVELLKRLPEKDRELIKELLKKVVTATTSGST